MDPLMEELGMWVLMVLLVWWGIESIMAWAFDKDEVDT